MRRTAVLLMGASLFFWSCLEPKEEEIAAALPPLVTSHVCRKAPYVKDMESFGVISYVRKADVVPLGGEIILSMNYEEGDRVREGSVLARLDTRKLEIQRKETEASIDNREAALNLAEEKLAESRRNIESLFYSIENAEVDYRKKEAEYKRMQAVLENKRQLFDAGGITEDEFLSVELSFQEKESSLRQARISLDMKSIGFRDKDLINAGYAVPGNAETRKKLFIELNTRVQEAERDVAKSELDAARSRIAGLEYYIRESDVRSPLAGIVARKYMETGEKASPEKPLYLIYPDEEVYAKIQVSEKDMVSLKIDQMAAVSTDTGGEEQRGRIHRISPWIDSTSRTGEVLILLDNAASQYKVGQFVKVRIDLDVPRDEIMLPEKNILGLTADEPYVYILRNRHLFRKEIKCGDTADAMVPVWEGLEEGDIVVENPRSSFRDGMEVRL